MFRIALLVLIVTNVTKAVPLDYFFAYNGSYTDYSLPTPLNAYGFVNANGMPFYGRNYYLIWQHGYGLMSFGPWNYVGFNTIPTTFPLTDSSAIIAGFWTNRLYSTNVSFGNQYCNRISIRSPYDIYDNDTRSKITTYLQRYLPNERPFTPNFFLSTTWLSILAPNQTNSSNTFQMSYTTDGVRSFVFLLYNNLQWSQTNNNMYAQAGLNAGNRMTYVRLPYSGTANITKLTDASNVGVPGLFIFRTDESATSERCGNTWPLISYPFFGTIFGSTPVFIHGPCFTNTTVGMLRCRFGPSATVDAVVVNELEIMCLTPPSTVPGVVTVYLSMDAGSTFSPILGYFYYTTLTLGSSVFSNVEMRANNRPIPIITPGEQINFTWYFSPWTRSKWPENGTMTMKIQMSTVTLNSSNNGLSFNSFTTIQTGMRPSSGFQSTSVIVPSIGNRVESVVFRVLVQNNVTGIIYGALHSTIFIMNTGPSSASNYCRTWMTGESTPSSWNQNLIDCPMTLLQARSARCCYGQDWSCFQTPYNITGNCAFQQGRQQNQEPSAIACFQSWNTNP